MKILAIDTSAKAASAAITEDGKILGEFYLNTRLTHSQTLLPMIHALLSAASLTLEEIGGLAVSAGPGSFTGLRIGIATVKGLGFGREILCAPVSTLEALCRNIGEPARICAVMDARCAQVYTATFDFDGETYTRVTEDEAVSLEELETRVKKTQKTTIFVGDGAEMCYNKMKALPNVRLSAENVRFQRASSVGFVAQTVFSKGEGVSVGELSPRYLRLPQAQRERLRRMSEGEEK